MNQRTLKKHVWRPCQDFRESPESARLRTGVSGPKIRRYTRLRGVRNFSSLTNLPLGEPRTNNREYPVGDNRQHPPFLPGLPKLPMAGIISGLKNASRLIFLTQNH